MKNGDDMLESIQKTKSDIDKSSIVASEKISIELFDKTTRKSTQLINNVDPEKFVDSRNQTYQFNLKEPIFANSIEFQLEAYANYKDVEFGFRLARDGSLHSKKYRIGDGTLIVEVNEIIDSFSIKPPRQYGKDTKFKSVVVNGLDLDSLESVLEKIGDVNKFISKLRSDSDKIVTKAEEASGVLAGFEDQKNSLNNEIATISKQRDDAQTELDEVNEELESLKLDLDSNRKTESDLQSRLEDLSDKIDQKNKESRTLNTDIAERESELKSLKDDINMFPSEISGFVEQGANNIKRYSLFASIPIALLVVYTLALFTNAADLTTVYNTRPDFNIWTLLLSRLPFALISIFVIHACYKLAKVFIVEIMRINQQRLNLSKIGIVAKDVTDASVSGLEDFSDDEIHELRTKLKMELLKDHLKSYLSEDFEHDLDINLWNRFLNRKKRIEKEVESNDGAE